MKVEAVIISRDYSDFLEHTLPENVQQLDDIIVVTSPEDQKTQAVCNKYGVHFICTDVFNEFGHDFNKGKAINVGLDNLRGGDWILHLDADIVLCKDFQRMLYGAQLERQNIYGADRINVYGYDAAQWPRRNRVLLPDVVVYHLDSEPTHKIGTNWRGRKSRPFGPEPAPLPKPEAPAANPAAGAELERRRHPPPWCRHRCHCRWPHCRCHPYQQETEPT